MNLSKINLNLLVALDALLTERHVTHAAHKVFVTQSAMSIALSQLRELLQDDLLVRSQQGMIPTKRALELHPQVQRLLNEIKTIVYATSVFDPSTASRVFQIGMSDYLELVILPRLIKKIAQVAPGITFKFSHLNSLDQYTPEMGQLELALGVICQGKAAPFMETESLFRDTAVCVGRKNHPLLAKPLTLKKFLQAKHISTNLYAGPVLTRVDKALQDLGHEREVVISLPHMIPALYLVKETDFLLASVELLAKEMVEELGLVMHKIPFPIPPVDIYMAWPKYLATDPAHLWLRNLVRELCTELQ